MRWIQRLLGAHPPSPPDPAPSPRVSLVASVAAADPVRDDAELFVVFYQWLTGPGAGAAGAHTDTLILDELQRLVSNPLAANALVPRVPQVVPQLLRSLRTEDASGTALARQIAQDVVLVAEVVREANSPFYAPATPIRNLEGAILLLGQNGLRMLLARVAFRPVINHQSGRHASRCAPRIWSVSETCAQAAGMLAAAGGADQFDCYLAGLVRNLGLVVAFRLIDQMAADTALPRSDQFCRRLDATTAQLSVAIARLWELPDSVCAGLAQGGQPGGTALAHVLGRAQRLALLRVLADAGALPLGAPDLTQLDPLARRCFEQLATAEQD